MSENRVKVKDIALNLGDLIEIVTPATEVRNCYIDGAVNELKRQGFRVKVAEHARGLRCGTYAATDAERLADLRDALLNPEVKAILCARGGYGCVHLLSEELQTLLAENPKWLIGFSDVSALHALWLKAGVPSLHCSMAKQLAMFNPATQGGLNEDIHLFDSPNDEEFEHLKASTRAMLALLLGAFDMTYTEPASPQFNRNPGKASGEIVGGNLAVLSGLAATPWDILDAEYLRGKILFLEDVGEKIYRVERMMKRLQLSGALDSIAGLVLGSFTDYKSDRNFESMEEMLLARLSEWGVKCPIGIGFPIGHTHHNLPIIEGARATLEVSPFETRLTLKL